ncbi:MAG: hypothetical protein ABWX68_03525 [Arthrobacter sp.]|uniref:sunset domain-containing protein n=1 Tax=Arthrobacter sp. TaxID=1667 RepID=UPI003483DD79
MSTSLGRAVATFAAVSSLVLGTAAGAAAAVVPAAATSSVTAATTAPRVTVQTIASPVVKVGGSATVRPSVAVSGTASVSTPTLTVKQGTRTLVSGKASAALKAGTYTVTTRVGYKVGTVAKSTSKTQTLVVRTAVALKTIAGKTAPYGKTAVVAPSVSVAAGAQLLSKTLTVKQGAKTLVSGKSNARLVAGKYTATTTARYRFPVKTTATVPTTTRKLVSDGNTAVPMTCKVVTVGSRTTETVPGLDIQLDVQEIDHKCTGAFDGAYDGWSSYYPDTVTNRAAELRIRTDFDPDADMTDVVLWNEDVEKDVQFAPVVGAAAKIVVFPYVESSRDYLYKTTTTSKQVTKTVWSAAYTSTRTQSLTIKAGPKPVRVAVSGGTKCPAGYPVKGNRTGSDNEWKYHVPGGRYYAVTAPEECFSTTAAARAAGYRASKA